MERRQRRRRSRHFPGGARQRISRRDARVIVAAETRSDGHGRPGKIKVEREARARPAEPLRTSVRGQAVNRYLDVLLYLDAHTDREPVEKASASSR